LVGSAWLLLASAHHYYCSPVRVEVSLEEADAVRSGQVIDGFFADLIIANNGAHGVVISDVTLRFERYAVPRYHMISGHVDDDERAGRGLVLGPGEEVRRRFWFPWGDRDLTTGLAIDSRGPSGMEGSILVTLGRRGRMGRRLELPGVFAWIEDGAFTGLSHTRAVARYIGS